MALKTRVPSIERTMRELIDRTLSPPAMSRQLARAAKRNLADAEAQNARVLGYVPEHETIVDGRRGAAEETVKPEGIIVHEFTTSLRGEVVRYVFDLLWQQSPVLKGRFRDSITIYADGVPVKGPLGAVDAEDILIVSTVAYARKIERGRSKKGGKQMFEEVAKKGAARYGNQASIKFSFAEPTGGGTHLEQWARKTGQTRKRWKAGIARHERARSQWNRRNPAILITFRKG